MSATTGLRVIGAATALWVAGRIAHLSTPPQKIERSTQEAYWKYHHCEPKQSAICQQLWERYVQLKRGPTSA